jgi:hypothetical protein
MEYQTLQQFIEEPFGKKSNAGTEYRTKYNIFKNANKIKLVGISLVSDEYYYHLKVPSESTTTYYDVVILFFSDDPKISKSHSLTEYKIKFFSNCPSFTYKYAALYKKEKYLIEQLYQKLNVNYLNTMPDKTNPDYQLMYDKSLFFACSYLLDHKLFVLNKTNVFIKKKTFSKFVDDIRESEDVMTDIAISKMEKSIKEPEKKKLGNLVARYGDAGKMNPVIAKQVGKNLADHKIGKVKPKAKVKPKPKKRAKKKTSGLT